MKATGQTEAFVYQAVSQGQIQIRPDGSVWRIAYRRFNRWSGKADIHPAKPRRIDETKSNGYRLVKVMIDGKQVTTTAHRLVWHHLNGPIPPGLTINHKNGVRDDNRPSNLELATSADQVRHSMNVLGAARCVNQDGENNHASKLRAAAVREIRRRRQAGETLKSIAQDFGVSDRTISKIARRERWASLG